MEVVVRDETARFCGGPLGTEGEEREGWGAAFTAISDTARGWQLRLPSELASKQASRLESS